MSYSISFSQQAQYQQLRIIRPLAVQFTYLLDEQFRGEVGELTARLLESPLSSAPSEDLTSNLEEAPLVDLCVGSTGHAGLE